MTLKVINPWDQSTVVEFPHDEGSLLEKKIALAHAAFARWRRVPLEERMRQVQAGMDKLRARTEEIARDVSQQMGKPIAEARREVETCTKRAEYMLSIARETLQADVLPAANNFHLRIEHEPLGVIFNLAAWNYPLLIPINIIAPALIAGNTVLLKHSGRTPLCGRHFEQAFASASIPGLVSNVVLTHDATAKVIADSRIAHVAFTGSVDGGREVYREAAKRFIDAGLELGGKDPAYVAEDADLDFAAENVVDGACYNAGQSCCAVERVYVHRRVHDAFVSRAKAVLERYKLGDPLDESTTMGPLASRSALDFLEGQAQDAVQRGAKLLLGGRRLAESRGNFFSPTLLVDVPNTANVMQDESFGPLVPILAVAGDDEAVKLMNESRYGLTASVWTRDRERAERVARDIDAGTIYQNRCDYLDPSLPWTGVRDSGKGSTLSRYGFLHLTRRKSLHFRFKT